jgi:response regulator RpfG family c-di-GMP phosphodiesterase
MITLRVYGGTLDRDQAIQELRRCAGNQFDPAVVETLCRVCGETDAAGMGRHIAPVQLTLPDSLAAVTA